MTMLSHEHSDTPEPETGIPTAPSDVSTDSAWVPVGFTTGEIAPAGKQGEPVERDGEQSDNTTAVAESQKHEAAKGTDIAPDKQLRVAEELLPEAETPVPEGEPAPEVPSTESTAPQEEGPAEMRAQQPVPPLEGVEPSIEQPEVQSALSDVTELQALEELQRLGLGEIEGQPLKTLQALARSRAQARQKLAAARAAFEQGQRERNEERVNEAFQHTKEALTFLDQARYPDGPAFALRRAALANDLVQARALLAAIDAWWWQRFAQALAEVYAHLKTPQQAQTTLAQAEALLEQWPDGENSVKGNARAALEAARKEVEEGLVERQFRALLDEAEAWIKLAKDTLDDATGGQANDGMSALEYVVRAEAAFKAAERLWNNEIKAQRRNLLKPSLDKTQSAVKAARDRCLTAFPQALVKRRQEVLTNEIARWREDYQQAIQAAKVKDGDWRFLLTSDDQEVRGLRKRLDELITLIRLDPHYTPPDDAVRELIRQREENRRRSVELVGEAKRLWRWLHTASHDADARPDAEPYVYQVRRLLEDAKKLDPDLGTDGDEKKVSDLLADVTNKWTSLKEDVEKAIAEVKEKEDELEQRLNEFEKSQCSTVDEVAKKAEDLKGVSETVGNKLSALAARLSRHVSAPLEWNDRISHLQHQYNEQKARVAGIAETLQRVQRLVEAWKTPHDLPRLIAETQALCCSDTLPVWIRRAAVIAAQEAVRQALPNIRRRWLPSVPRQIELTWLVGRLSEAAAQLERVETPVANREASL